MRLNRAVIVLFVAALAASAQTHAAEPGESTYVVVHRDGAKKVVALTPAAARELERQADVAYVQRLWDGKDAPAVQANAVEAPPAAVPQSGEPKWRTGTYAYDRTGNVMGMGADTYAYDAAGRLVRASVSGKPEEYEYDRFGNLRMAGNAAATQSNNRLPGAGYDSVGNVTSDEDGTYRYDAVSMMTGHTPVETVTRSAVPRRMIYTAEDERIVAITAPGLDNETAQIGVRGFDSKVVREWEKSEDVPVWRRDYVYAEGRLVGGERQVSGGGTGYRHFHLDHLGSVRLVTRGGDAARILDVKYFPFGEEADSSIEEYTAFKHAPLEPMKFTGHERDYYGATNAENDEYLDYMHARYYAPSFGRFLSVDPASASASPESPQTWNRYSYAFNDALDLVDPDGMWPARTHTKMINKAFPGLSVMDKAPLFNASQTADSMLFGGQNPWNAYKHGLSWAGDTPAEAAQKAGAYYTEQINKAISALASGDKGARYTALYQLGLALHLVMDMTSPSHRGFQEWDLDKENIAVHMMIESREPTADEMNMAIAMMRAAYAQVFGVEAADDAANNPPPPEPKRFRFSGGPRFTDGGSFLICIDGHCF